MLLDHQALLHHSAVILYNRRALLQVTLMPKAAKQGLDIDAADDQIKQRQSDIDCDTKDFTTDYIIKAFQDDLFYIPEYQRQFVWDSKRQRRFIESVVLGLPIPFLFIAEMSDGRLEIVGRDTPRELALRSSAHRRGLRFRVDWPLPGTRRRADLVFIQARVAVFVDGCFWHGCPLHGTWPKTNAQWWRDKITTNVRRDRATTATLEVAGWRVLRFWEHEDMSEATARIVEAVRQQSF